MIKAIRNIIKINIIISLNSSISQLKEKEEKKDIYEIK